MTEHKSTIAATPKINQPIKASGIADAKIPEAEIAKTEIIETKIPIRQVIDERGSIKNHHI